MIPGPGKDRGAEYIGAVGQMDAGSLDAAKFTQAALSCLRCSFRNDGRSIQTGYQRAAAVATLALVLAVRAWAICVRLARSAWASLRQSPRDWTWAGSLPGIGR